MNIKQAKEFGKASMETTVEFAKTCWPQIVGLIILGVLLEEVFGD